MDIDHAHRGSMSAWKPGGVTVPAADGYGTEVLVVDTVAGRLDGATGGAVGVVGIVVDTTGTVVVVVGDVQSYGRRGRARGPVRGHRAHGRRIRTGRTRCAWFMVPPSSHRARVRVSLMYPSASIPTRIVPPA